VSRFKNQYTGLVVPITALIILFIFSFLYTLQPVSAQEQIGGSGFQNKIIIFIIDFLPLNSLDNPDLIHIRELIETGAVGIMNTNTGGSRIPADTYLTIGSSARAMTGPYPHLGKNADDHYAEMLKSALEFERRTGLQPESHNVLNLNIEGIKKINDEKLYSVVPGQLGTALRSIGKKTAVLGNSDSLNQMDRPVVNLLMDNRGIVDYGSIGEEILTKDITEQKIKTSSSILTQKASDMLKSADVLAVDFGDTGRLEKDSFIMADSIYYNKLNELLVRADQMVKDLTSIIDLQSSLFIMLSPTPSIREQEEGRLLTPVIINGKGFRPGLLTSSTTRRKGLIANLDIAPTALDFYQIKAQDMFGSPVKSIGTEKDPFSFLVSTTNRAAQNYLIRPPIMQSYLSFLIIIYLLLLLMMILKIKAGIRLESLLKFSLLFILSIPVSLLIIPLFELPDIIETVSLILLISIIIASISLHFNNKLDPLLFLSGITFTAIIFDLFNGSYLMKRSLLGYDPIGGGRYYGLGNEYMGIFLGAVLFFTTAILDRFPDQPLKKYIPFVYILSITACGAPFLGANFGATISAVTAFTVTIYYIFEIRLSGSKLLLWLCTILLLTASALWGLPFIISFESGNTHIQNFFTAILEGNDEIILNTVRRKFDMNLKLIRHTIWSRVFMAALGVLGIIVYRPAYLFQHIKNKYRYLPYGFMGTITASVVVLLTNDSGIVGAATTLLYPVSALLFLALTILMKKD